MGGEAWRREGGRGFEFLEGDKRGGELVENLGVGEVGGDLRYSGLGLGVGFSPGAALWVGFDNFLTTAGFPDAGAAPPCLTGEASLLLSDGVTWTGTDFSTAELSWGLATLGANPLTLGPVLNPVTFGANPA